MMNYLETLFHSLKQRRRPEDVADLVLLQLGRELAPTEEVCLQKAGQGSLPQIAKGKSSMVRRFGRAGGLQRQVATAQGLFATAPALDPAAADDPEVVAQFIREVSQEIGKSFG